MVKVKRISKVDVRARVDAMLEDLVSMTKSDSWINMTTGLGDPDYDPSGATYFGARFRCSQKTLDRLYMFNALAARIVERPAFDSMRERFEVRWPDDPQERLQAKLQNEFKRLKLYKHLFRVQAMARLYGTALLVPKWNDGAKSASQLEKPLNLESVGGIEHFQVFDRYQVEPLNGLLNDDLQSSNYGKPELYVIRSDLSGRRMVLHHSRVIRFDGITGPLRIMLENDGFGFSILDRVFPELRTYGSSIQYAENLMRDLTQDVFQIGNLRQLLASNATDQIRERFRIIRKAKSILNAVIIGADEKYEKRSATVTGAEKLLEQFQYALGAATGIPLTFLFARSPAGQNATGESDVLNYYDQVSARQEDELRDPVEVLVGSILQGLKAGDKEREDASIEFNPLWQMSDEERAKVELAEAQADEARIESGVLFPEEAARSRFGGHDSKIQLDEQLRKATEEEANELGKIANEEFEAGNVEPLEGGVDKTQDIAFNGAQIKGAVNDIVINVGLRRLPRESGIAMLVRLFNFERPAAEEMMGEVGRSWFIEQSTPDLPPGNEEEEEKGNEFE